MQHRIITSLAVLMGALILAIIAGVVPVFPFSTEETAYAQESGRLNDATLAPASADPAGLVLGGGVLDPTYAHTTTEYTVRVGNSVNVVTVAAVTNNPDATYSISPRDADGTTDDIHDVSLRAGQNTRITVTVTAEDRRTRQTYTVLVYRERSTHSTDSTLSALSLDGVSLSPRFSSGTTAYNARVRYDVTTVTVAATASNIGAEDLVVALDATEDGDKVIPLGDPGTTTDITVTVTAEDGSMTTPPYTIAVYRESGPVLGDDATLDADAGLSLSGVDDLTPPFDPGITEYTTSVANTVDFVTVTAATDEDNAGAMLDIMPADQNLLTTGAGVGHQVYLTPGTSTAITVTVTAENRSTNTYTVTVYRERITESTDSTLSALSLDGVSLSPRFSSGTTAYNARVRYDVTTVTVAATASDIGAEDLVVALDATEDGDKVIPLGDPGTTTDITVTVTAEDGSMTTPPYTIAVYRESGPVLGDDATLDADAGLSLSGVEDDLTPPFDPGITEYTTSVANTVDFVNVTAATDEDNAGAMLDIMPADQNLLTTGAGVGHQVYLTAGARTAITVTVTAENGSTNTYTIMVYRQRATPSTDATLSALSLDEVSLSPDFNPETTEYDARVRYDVDEVTVEHTAVDIGATAPITVGEIDNTNPIVGTDVTLGAQGVNTFIRVRVMAEAGGDAKIYTITVYRENIVLSDDATLLAGTGPGALSLGADVTLSPTPFASGTNVYTARVENPMAFANVVATAADAPGAMVDIMPTDRDSLEDGHQVYLAPGAHTVITITVTAEDGSTNPYTFTIYRKRATASIDNTLSTISLSGAVLSPAFDAERLTYTATAANSADITTVTAPANDIGALPTEIVPGDSDPVTAGHQVPLSSVGATRITVTVTPEAGVMVDSVNIIKVYEIIVYRDAEVSSDATLQSLDLSGITLSPAFDPATTAYTAEAEDIEMTTVEAMAAHPGATVEGTGEMSLTVGENVIMVTVTAEDDTSQTYTVTVTVLMEDTQTLLDRYDINPENGRIDKSEVLAAINDYIFDETITRDQVLEVINLYIFR